MGSGFLLLCLGLVVAGGVDGEFSQDLAGCGVDDLDVEVVDQDQDAGSGMGSADADVVQAAVDAEGDFPAGVDDVGTYPVVRIRGVFAGRGGFGSAGVDRGGNGLVGQGAVGAFVVVTVAERIQEGLELGDAGRLGRLSA